MRNSNTVLSEAITDLNKAFFTENINLCDVEIKNIKIKRTLPAKDFKIVQFFRFEGMSDPDDNMVLFTIKTSSGDKGLLVGAYGAYSGNIPKRNMDKRRIVI